MPLSKAKDRERKKLAKLKDFPTYSNLNKLMMPDGSILNLDSLERNKEKLVKLINYMESSKFRRYLSEIRLGVYGCTLGVVKILLN